MTIYYLNVEEKLLETIKEENGMYFRKKKEKEKLRVNWVTSMAGRIINKTQVKELVKKGYKIVKYDYEKV